MGRKNKKYVKTLHQQAYETLKSMQAFGESKKEAMKNGTSSTKIFSFSTYNTYWKHIKYFIRWVQEYDPTCTTLKKARKYVPVWLRIRSTQTTAEGNLLSAWTIQTEAAALNKLYGIKPDDPNRFQQPKRMRQNIKRSRTSVKRDLHFSLTNNDVFIKFCQGTGLRRMGIQNLHGKDLFSSKYIAKELLRLTSLPPSKISTEDFRWLQLYKDTQLFVNPTPEYFIYVKEKGGRERLAPVIGINANQIVERIKRTALNEKVWLHVPKNADIHSYRSDYANTLYKLYARPLTEIPYDKINRGSGKKYQSDVYFCRKDEAGKKLDRHAMLLCSKALGHNRIDVVANNYLRGL